MTTDPISDMLIRIKNATLAGRKTTVIPYSKIKMAVAGILEKNNFLKKAEKRGKKNNSIIDIEISYDEKGPILAGVERISKSSRRIYRSYKELNDFAYRQGITIISTPKGIITVKEARKDHVGGEVLCRVW